MPARPLPVTGERPLTVDLNDAERDTLLEALGARRSMLLRLDMTDRARRVEDLARRIRHADVDLTGLEVGRRP